MNIRNSFFDEKLLYKKLKNNLEIFYMPKKGFAKKYAILATNYGSNDLEFISPFDGEHIKLNEGIAHFLEHKMFEQPDGSDAFAEFSKHGANANAFTNFNMTAYLFSTTDNFYPSLEHLVSYVNTPHFTDENVQKEKGIIGQEIKMYDDNGDWRLFFNTLRGMYINHHNKIDIAGTVESIEKITKEELYKCYNSFYSPSNMALFVIGDLDFDKVCEVVEKTASYEHSFEGQIKRIMKEEPNEIAQKLIEEEMEVSIPMFSIGYKEKMNGEMSGEVLARRSIETEIIMGCLLKKGSELNEYLYDNQLIFEPLSCEYNAHNDYGYSIISGETRNISQVHEKIKECLEKAKKDGIDEEVFERIKKARLGSFVRAFDSIESIANSFLNYYFEGINYFDIYDYIKAVTLEDINDRLREHFDETMAVLSIINPIESVGN